MKWICVCEVGCEGLTPLATAKHRLALSNDCNLTSFFQRESSRANHQLKSAIKIPIAAAAVIMAVIPAIRISKGITFRMGRDARQTVPAPRKTQAKNSIMKSIRSRIH